MSTEILDLEPIQQTEPRREALPAVTDGTPMAMMLAAQRQGASLSDIREMMAIQREWEANEARKQYNAAFSAFKSEAVRIIKNRQVTDGPLKGKSYAELHAVVDALTPALSRHGLSASWKLTKDEKDWMEVTCYLRHVSGHQESVSMGGPPDAGGAKNAIQARASSKSYLERYTLKAICGVAEGGEDDDGAGSRGNDWTAAAEGATTLEELDEIARDGNRELTKGRNVPAFSAFMKAVMKRREELKKVSNV